MTYRLFKGIAEAVKKHSMALLFFDVEDTKSELSAIDQCLNARVDGIVATYREDPVYLERLRGVINDGMNVVTVLDRSGGHLLNCPNVMADHETGGYLAVEYLVGNGHRRIAHLASLGYKSVGTERFKGYKKALQAFNLPYQEEMVIEDIEIHGFNGSKKLLELKELPDAVFCWNDKSALHAQRTFKEAGLNIEVVGFDNREFLQYMDTPFCSVDFPLKKVGETAVEILLSEDLSRRTVIIPTKLIKYK
jgi:DNA-binding LacI/PurR family transcriptional regulator